MKFDLIDLIASCIAVTLLVLILASFPASKKKPVTHIIVTHSTNDNGAVVSTNVVQRDLPEGIVIQKSNDGKYRWVAFSKEWPNGNYDPML